jgi:transposase
VFEGFLERTNRSQVNLLPACVDDYVAPDALVRIVDAFVESLNLTELGFNRAIAAATGRPGFHPGDMLRLYIWGYLNQIRSSRHLERACVRDLEALWLLRQLAPDYRTIAAFRHDNPEAIIGASAAFIPVCRESGLISGRLVALDGTKMQAVASKKNIAGAERPARDLAHTEREIAYYLDRLDIIDEQVAQGYDDQPVASASVWRRHRLPGSPQGPAPPAAAGTRNARRKGAGLRRARGKADGLRPRAEVRGLQSTKRRRRRHWPHRPSRRR